MLWAFRPEFPIGRIAIPHLVHGTDELMDTGNLPTKARPHIIDLVEAYDNYFESGHYDHRYPAPNLNMLRTIRSCLSPGDRVLDFGCGNGRYIAPLLTGHVQIIGYDPSPAALEALARFHQPAIDAGRLIAVGGSLEDLEAATPAGSLDLAMLVFGVLAHVQGAAARRHTLTVIRRLLRPGGKLIVTVPNIARRFRAEQALNAARIASGELEAGDIIYQRQAKEGPIELYYHLFDEPEFRSLLGRTGFDITHFGAESVLPERSVLRLPAGALIDRALMAVTPTRFTYGFAAIATRQGAE
jgi:tRNA (uracil-5-)-methyltransferase TRM9